MIMLQITKENFEMEVLKSDKPVIVDFWAVWCGPCKMVAPTFEALSAELPEVKFGKVNVDEQPDLAQQFKVMTIPTFILFKDGKAVDQVVGALPKDKLKEFALK